MQAFKERYMSFVSLTFRNLFTLLNMYEIKLNSRPLKVTGDCIFCCCVCGRFLICPYSHRPRPSIHSRKVLVFVFVENQLFL